MYKYQRPTKTTIQVNTSYAGERIEEKINRIVNNKEPISDGAPLIYTDRSEGIKAETNIKTDRWEIAVEAMDYVSKSHMAKREERLKAFEDKLNKANDKTTETKGGETPTAGAEPAK